MVNMFNLHQLFTLTSDYKFATLKDFEVEGIKIPKGFKFDGVTVKAPFTALFGAKALREGLLASCVHDYLCEHKSEYTLKFSTKLLTDLWVESGLKPWKAKIVGFSVNLFQLKQGGWKNDRN